MERPDDGPSASQGMLSGSMAPPERVEQAGPKGSQVRRLALRALPRQRRHFGHAGGARAAVRAAWALWLGGWSSPGRENMRLHHTTVMRGSDAREARLRPWAAAGRRPNPGAAMRCRLRGAAVMRVGLGSASNPGHREARRHREACMVTRSEMSDFGPTCCERNGLREQA